MILWGGIRKCSAEVADSVLVLQRPRQTWRKEEAWCLKKNKRDVLKKNKLKVFLPYF